MSWTVVKVGGSLFDLPDLGDRLRRFLQSVETDGVLLVPGGGATAEAVRMLDRVHQLGDETAHWLAIDALSLNAQFLHRLLPELPVGCPSDRTGRLILDAEPFFAIDECRAEHVPHTWDVTSDSLAVRAATLINARELVLLKSVGWDGGDWAEACAIGIVDRYFAEALRQAPRLDVRVVNLREPR